MADKTRTATVKRDINEVNIVLHLKARRINENGTFSNFEVTKITGPNKTIKASMPPMMGGAIYLKVEDLDGITLLDAAESAENTPKKKLF